MRVGCIADEMDVTEDGHIGESTRVGVDRDVDRALPRWFIQPALRTRTGGLLRSGRDRRTDADVPDRRIHDPGRGRRDVHLVNCEIGLDRVPKAAILTVVLGLSGLPFVVGIAVKVF